MARGCTFPVHFLEPRYQKMHRKGNRLKSHTKKEGMKGRQGGEDMTNPLEKIMICDEEG